MIRKLIKLVPAAILLVPVLAACNPSLVAKGDPLYDYIGKDYYLGRPLSGPQFRNPNVYGTPPFIPTGTKVKVVSIERSTPVYRIVFTGPEKCKHQECHAHWRNADDASFKTKFDDVFRTENPLDKLKGDVRPLVEKEQISSSMTKEEVRLSIGDPNRVVEQDGSTRWIYERRNCDVNGRLLAIPFVALVFEGDTLKDYKQLNETDWYVTNEPVNKLSGLCEGVQGLPEDTPVRAAQSGEINPGAQNEDPSNTDLGPKTGPASDPGNGSL